MKTVAAVLAAVWLIEVLVAAAPLGGANAGPLGWFETLSLVPSAVVERHQYWRLVTFAVLHDPRGIGGLIFSLLGLWFFGGELESRWGLRRLIALWLVSSLVGALLVVLAGQLYLRWWVEIVVGPLAATSAMVMAWCALHLDQKMSFFGLANLEGRHFAILSVVISLVSLAVQRSAGDIASLGGFVVGWAWVYFDRFRPTPRRRTESSPRLRVLRGGAKTGELPN